MQIMFDCVVPFFKECNKNMEQNGIVESFMSYKLYKYKDNILFLKISLGR